MQWPLAPTEAALTNPDVIPWPSDPYGAPRDGGRTHMGFDFAAERGWNVRAIAPGRVYWEPWSIDQEFLIDECPPHWYAGGWQIWIQHDGFWSRYLHLTQNSIQVNRPNVPISQIPKPIYYGGAGRQVNEGQVIGTVGSSGGYGHGSSGTLLGPPIGYGPHLHLEVGLGQISLANNGIDPIPFLKDRIGSPTPQQQEEVEDMKLIRWNNNHIFAISREAVYHVPDVAKLNALRPIYGPVRDVNDAGLTAVILANGVPWAELNKCLQGTAGGADNKYWTRP